jgi:ribosomal protein S18 acetylase RimI-like enzyme
MADDRVPVRRVRFEEYEAGIETLLTQYHGSVAEGFRRWLRRADQAGDGESAPGSEFSPEAYANGELEKDVAYLEANGSREPVIVALDGETPVGCVYLYRLSDDDGEVKRLYVREAYRDRGLGRALMGTLIDAAAEAGYSTLRLDTAPFMRSAADLYRDLGFEPYEGGESVSNIPMAILDEITYMRLSLNDRQ